MGTQIFVVFAVIVAICAANKLPNDIPLCEAGDVSCIAKVATEFIRHNYRGRPDMNIPRFDPFHMNSVTLARNGSLRFRWHMTDLDVIGLSKIVIHEMVGFERDPRDSKFEMKATIPQLELKGDYNATGRILIVPFSGIGKMGIILKDVDVIVKFKPTVYRKDGKTFLGIDQFKMFATPRKASFHFTNLFNGNIVLGDNINRFLNENWGVVWEEYSPVFFESATTILATIAQNIFHKYSYDDIFLPE